MNKTFEWEQARKDYIEETKKYNTKMREFIVNKRAIKLLKEETKALESNPAYCQWKKDCVEQIQKSSDPALTAFKLGKQDKAIKLTNKTRDLYEKTNLLSKELNQLRAKAAIEAEKAVTKWTKNLKENNAWLEYEEKTLGKLENIGFFQSGSLSWLKNRQTGIGGSDFYHFIYDNGTVLQDFLTEKFKPLSEEDSQVEIDYTTAIGRGHCMEEFIRFEFQNNHPELRVAHCKSSWQNTEYDFGKANFDGLTLDDTNTPNAVLEIKTGSAHTWEEKVLLTKYNHSTNKGTVKTYNRYYLLNSNEDSLHETIMNPILDGKSYQCCIPLPYLYQILWYATQAELETAYLAAIIDDMVYVEYEFNINGLKEDLFFDKCFDKAQRVWGLLSQVEKDKNGIPQVIAKARKGLPKKVSASYKELVETYNGLPYGTIMRGEIKTPNISDFVRCKGDYIGIDLETSGFTPAHARILQFACVKWDSENEPEEVFNYFYNIPEQAKNSVGYGVTDVHGIDESVVENEICFLEDEQQIIDFLRLIVGKTVVAHSFGFEQRFLSKSIPGWDLLLAARLFRKMDTRTLCSYLLPFTQDNKLQSFVEGVGLEYVDAHNALNDTVMMMQSLYLLSDRTSR